MTANDLRTAIDGRVRDNATIRELRDKVSRLETELGRERRRREKAEASARKFHALLLQARIAGLPNSQGGS